MNELLLLLCLDSVDELRGRRRSLLMTVCTAVLKPEQRQAKRQKIEENRLKKQQLASVTGSLSTQMTDDEHQLTRVITDAFIRHLNLPHTNTSQVHSVRI